MYSDAENLVVNLAAIQDKTKICFKMRKDGYVALFKDNMAVITEEVPEVVEVKHLKFYPVLNAGIVTGKKISKNRTPKLLEKVISLINKQRQLTNEDINTILTFINPTGFMVSVKNIMLFLQYGYRVYFTKNNITIFHDNLDGGQRKIVLKVKRDVNI